MRHIDRLEIDLSAGGRQRRHLVLLGPNGSGKSILFDAIADELEHAVGGRAHPASELSGQGGGAEAIDREIRMAHFGRPVRLSWSRPAKDVRAAFEKGQLIVAYLPNPRETAIATDPAPVDTDPKKPRERAGGRLLQMLVNRRTEQELATKSGDELRAKVHLAWLVRIQSTLRRLLHQPELSIAYDRDGLHLDLPDGRRMQFDQLSRGHASAIAMWAEIMMRVEAARLRADDPMLEPSGVIVIDGAEEDLEVRLQRELLPALAELYPNVQLLVSTHSPLVALSLDDAIVYDLGTQQARPSEEVRQRGLDGLLVHMLAAPDPPTVLSSPPPPMRASERPPLRPPRPPSEDSVTTPITAIAKNAAHGGPPLAFTPPGAPSPVARAAPPPWKQANLQSSSDETTAPGPGSKPIAPRIQTQKPQFTMASPPKIPAAPPMPKIEPAMPKIEPAPPMPKIEPGPWSPELASVDSLASIDSLEDEPTSPEHQLPKKPTVPPPARMPPKKNSARKGRHKKDTLTGSGPWAPEDD